MSVALAARRAARQASSPSLSWRDQAHDAPPEPLASLAPRVLPSHTGRESPSLLGASTRAHAPKSEPPDEDEDDEWDEAVEAVEAVKVAAPDVGITLPLEGSPSLRAQTARLGAKAGAAPAPKPRPRPNPMDVAPSQQPPPPQPPQRPPPPGTRLVKINDRVVPMTRAPMKRASRAARPSLPSEDTRTLCRSLVGAREQELKAKGRTKQQADDTVKYRAGGPSSGKGPAIRAQQLEEQARMNHIAAIKAKNVDTHNSEASYLLWGNTAEPCYDRLVEHALKANAVNSCVIKRKDTQGAGQQTSRINCKGMGQAAATQCVNAAIAMAIAEERLRQEGVVVRGTVASNAVDPCVFASANEWGGDLMTEEDDPTELVGVVSTAQLVYNSNPTKLGAESIRSAAKKLAKLELEREAISERMASANYMLTAMCRSVAGGYEIDSVWASFVLVVYLCSDPRGRPLLKETSLTDLDVQTACAFEAYGRGEITRRARLRASQEEEARKASEKLAKRRKKTGEAGPSSAPPPAAHGHDSDSNEFEFDAETGLRIEDDAASIVNDDAYDLDECPDLEAAAAVDEVVDPIDTERADQKVLATKRKRASKGFASASTSDPCGMMSWWYKALRCPDKSILDTLITATKTNARDAAMSTLEVQAQGSSITSNRVIVEQSAQNAIRSAQALVPFVDRKARDVPTWVGFSLRDAGQGQPSAAIGISRVPHMARNSVLHACRLPPRAVRPKGDDTGVLWSIATQELASRCSDDPYHTPGVLERYALIGRMRANSTELHGKFKSQFSSSEQRTVEGLTRYIKEETMRPLPSAPGGITRSFIALKTAFTVHQLTFDSAGQLADEGRNLWRKVSAMSMEGRETEKRTCEMLGQAQQSAKRIEPLCTPATRLAVGLRLNELLRRFMQGRTRKNEPCKVLLGHHTSAEVGKDVPPIFDTEPMPLATITDFDVRVRHPWPASAATSTTSTTQAGASVALHVCLDGAIRVPEMMDACQSTDANAAQRKRALLYAASSQASYIGDVGAAISAAAANANINSSKKISCADVNTLCLLSVWDVYGGGITNVQRSFASTPYSGAYGPGLDVGITSSGLFGHFYRSDRRGHGSMTLSQRVADELAAMLAHSYHVEVGDKKYALSPVQTRGIPHSFTPGVHSVLKDCTEAVDAVLVAHGHDADETALRPDVESTADSTLRYCFRNPEEISCATGRSYLPDATAEDEALVTEPLFRRPCQASVGDNPFATAYPYVDALWNAVNALALIAREAGGVDELHRLITSWHRCREGAPLDGDPIWAADACVLLFGAIYPHQHAIAKPVVPEGYAKALPFLARAQRSGHELKHGGRLFECGPGTQEWADTTNDADDLWARFSTRASHVCPWQQGVAPLLRLILKKQGSHDISHSELAEFRTALDNLCSKGAWLAYSEDGTKPPPAPNPAAGCATMNDVRRPTLDPVFFTQGEKLDMGDARGALIGLHPFQLRQLYALMLGAHLDGVTEAQVVRNEGGLLLRESALPTILKMDGTKRSDKGIAPTQTESDQAAYGGRKAKVYGASFQMEAWDANARLLAPLFCAIEPPMPKAWRAAGEFGDPSWLRKYLQEQQEEQMLTHADEGVARRRMEQAASSVLAGRAIDAAPG